MKKLLITCTTTSILAASAHAAVMLEQWNFDDSAGTGLANVSNTGSVGTAWNFNLAGQPGEGATDGTGNLVLEANTDAGSSTISSDYTRKATFSSSVTTGAYTFEYSLSNWDLNDTAGADAIAGQEGFTLKIDDGAGNQINLITALTGADNNVRVRHATNGTVSGTAAQSTIGLSGSTLVVRVEGNLDDGTFTTSYDTGSGFNTLIADGTGLNSIGEIILSIEGDQGGWSSTDSMSVDYIQLEAIPEPSSTALIGLASLGFILRRRR
ncbi:hypothetical protein Rhal01_00519 [Rubritalea halochordaticola]|uniref:Ice-binding protein C-terminal domain-containing protein n=1 Tax=Rubritalea halochordaticola TaxID=714537 RepID=A0ABP9UYD2_9BACT